MNNSAVQTNPVALPPVGSGKSGFTLEPYDFDAALDRMAEEADPQECDETLEYLMKALNETRAEGGERILFPDLLTAEVVDGGSL